MPLTTARAAEWDGFVATAEDGSFFHRAGWAGIFRDIFGLSPHYLFAERDGRIVGVLPLVHQKSLLFGNALIAAPFLRRGRHARRRRGGRAPHSMPPPSR